MFDAFILDGTVTLLAAAVLGLELVVAVVLARRGPVAVAPLIANLLSGLFLILALRAALVGAGATAIGIWLALGFLAHLADLAFRLRGRRQS
jgi:hypothetical protein